MTYYAHFIEPGVVGLKRKKYFKARDKLLIYSLIFKNSFVRQSVTYINKRSTPKNDLSHLITISPIPLNIPNDEGEEGEIV